jgi:hypothetical protein
MRPELERFSGLVWLESSLPIGGFPSLAKVFFLLFLGEELYLLLFNNTLQ